MMEEKRRVSAAVASGTSDTAPKVRWDDSKTATTYANVVNAASTREEVSLFFGTNQTWNFGEKREFSIELTNRIVLNPFAAKRLVVLLDRILGEYEKRFGPLPIEGFTLPGGTTASSQEPP